MAFDEHHRKTSTTLAMALCMVLPWLNPWAPSPQANTVPLLVSWACLGSLLLGSRGLQTSDVARGWACAALFSSVIGLFQYFGLADVLSPWVHVPPYPGEAMGNLRQRNQLATLTGMGVLAVLWWQGQGLKARHALWMLILLALGNAATGSRTGLLHMLLMAVLSVVWASRHRGGAVFAPWSWRWACAALAFYLLATWALPVLLEYRSGQNIAGTLARMGHNEGCGSRRVLWTNVLHLIGQKPWSGWGWGELKYAHYMTDYPGERFCDILGNAHNLPLHLAVTLGVPVATVLVVLGLGLIGVARPWASRSSHHQLAWSVLALIGLHSMLEFPLWYGPFQLAVLLCLAVLSMPSGSYGLCWPTPLRWCGVAVLVCVSWVSIDYLRVRQVYVASDERLMIWREQPMTAAKGSWLFASSAAFADLTLTPVTQSNAARVLQVSQDLLHYSPEPRVIQPLIQSAQMLGQTELANAHQRRLQRAFPNH